MLTMVDVITSNGETLSLPLQDVSDGFLIEEIEGLDPVKAEIVSSKFANLDGTQYQASRRDARNIILKLILQPDYVSHTVTDLRAKIYSFLMPQSNVTLRFYFDDVAVAEIAGMVESVDTPHFTKEPAVSISLLCFKPDFVGLMPILVPGSSTSGTTEQTIEYGGSVSSGFKLTLNVNRTISELIIYGRPKSNVQYEFEFIAPLSAGDILEISTVSGAKGAWVTRAGVRSPILYGVSPASTWLNLFPGTNKIRVSIDGAAIPYTIEFTPRYGGL